MLNNEDEVRPQDKYSALLQTTLSTGNFNHRIIRFNSFDPIKYQEQISSIELHLDHVYQDA